MAKVALYTDRINGSRSQVIALDALAQRPVLLETVVLALICFVDSLTTIYLVRSGMAIEANPLLQWSYRYGDVAFFLTKAVWYLLPLLILESLRPKNEAFVRTALRLGILGYFGVYVFGTLAIHAYLWR